MKKIMISILIIISVGLCWIVGLSAMKKVDNTPEINYYLQIANEQFELEAYGSAINCYKKVISIEDTEIHNHKLADIYNTAGKVTLYKETLENIITKFPGSNLAYEQLATYYYDLNNYKDCVSIVLLASSSGVRTEVLNELYSNSAYNYSYTGGTYEEASMFVEDLAIVKINGKMGFVNSGMTASGLIKYDFVSHYKAGLAAVTFEDESYFIDTSGEKYLASSLPYSKLWSLSNGRAVAILEDKYVYVDSTFKPAFGEYDYATSFSENVAAVRNGLDWIIIDINGTQIGDITYEDVIINENNIVFNQGVAFVKLNGSYIMINTKGEQISELIFEDAKPFYTDVVTAVKIDNKWGFINTAGEIIIEAQYDDANAFGKGLAAVKIEDKWGFITKSNVLVIENVFEDAKCFSNNGIVPVKANGVWKYIMLLI